MVNIESIESIQGEKNDSFQEKMEPIVEEVENLVTSDSAAAIEDIKLKNDSLTLRQSKSLLPTLTDHLLGIILKNL
jgi:hypothetical protein